MVFELEYLVPYMDGSPRQIVSLRPGTLLSMKVFVAGKKSLSPVGQTPEMQSPSLAAVISSICIPVYAKQKSQCTPSKNCPCQVIAELHQPFCRAGSRDMLSFDYGDQFQPHKENSCRAF